MKIDSLLKTLLRNPRHFKSVVTFAGILYLAKLTEKKDPIRMLMDLKIHPSNYLPVIDKMDIPEEHLDEYLDTYLKIKAYTVRLKTFLNK